MGLEAKTSMKLIDDITKATDFSKMKLMKQASEEEFRQMCGADQSLFRKGIVGDWKSYFTVAQSEEFDTLINHWSQDRNFKFIYN